MEVRNGWKSPCLQTAFRPVAVDLNTIQLRTPRSSQLNSVSQQEDKSAETAAPQKRTSWDQFMFSLADPFSLVEILERKLGGTDSSSPSVVQSGSAEKTGGFSQAEGGKEVERIRSSPRMLQQSPSRNIRHVSSSPPPLPTPRDSSRGKSSFFSPISESSQGRSADAANSLAMQMNNAPNRRLVTQATKHKYLGT